MTPSPQANRLVAHCLRRPAPPHLPDLHPAHAHRHDHERLSHPVYGRRGLLRENRHPHRSQEDGGRLVQVTPEQDFAKALGGDGGGGGGGGGEERPPAHHALLRVLAAIIVTMEGIYARH